MESNKFLLDKAGEKGRFCELSTNETTEKKKKKTENAIPAVTKKATNFGLKLFNGTPKSPYKFKETVS